MHVSFEQTKTLLQQAYPEVVSHLGKYLDLNDPETCIQSMYSINEDRSQEPRKGFTLFLFFQKLIGRPDALDNPNLRKLVQVAHHTLNSQIICHPIHTQMGGANEHLRNCIKGRDGTLPADFIASIHTWSEKGQKTIIVRTQPKPPKIKPVPLDPEITKDYGKFPEERCLIQNLAAKAAELRADNFAKASALHGRLGVQTFDNPALDIAAEKNATHKTLRHSKFECTDISGLQKFIFTACPKDATHAAALFDVLIQRGGELLVSTLEAPEAPHRWNNFRKKEKVEALQLRDGWSLQHVGEEVLARGANPGARDLEIVETTLKAKKADVEKVIKQLHMDGWIDNQPISDEPLLLHVLLRMKDNSPSPLATISINCRGGVGRTGTTGMCFELMRDIDRQIEAGVALSDISVNIPEALYRMRMEGRRVVGSPAQFAQIYSVMGRYHRHLSATRDLLASIGLPAAVQSHVLTFQ